MQLIKDRCTGCGYCVLVCPYDALKSNGWAELFPANCTDCNLCVYACPSDCFVPEVDYPLRRYRPRLKPVYDAVIVGSGLGGLMTGLALARAGHSVVIFEKLGFPGGRYTELNYRSTSVTTGAWTNLGPRSHIGRFLAEMGINLDYISLADVGLKEQYTIRFPDGRRYASLFDLLTPQARKGWLKAIVTGRQQLRQRDDQIAQGGSKARPDDQLDRISAADYITEFCPDPDLLAAVEAITATASGLKSTEMPASEYIQITLDGREAGSDFAMPRGGVRAIIRALTGALRQAGGELYVRSPVSEILVESGQSSIAPGPVASGVRLADGREVSSRVVIHNGGPGRFIQLVRAQHLPSDYVDRLTGLVRVECAALFCATREPLFTDAPITMTPGCRRVVGVFSPTILNPDLSKIGLHLIDAFFPLCSSDRSGELALALADMRDLFPNFDDVVEWTLPMFFTGAWSGTESAQTFGQTGDNRLDPVTPIKNCFLVGMDVKGSGVAGDLIPLGVRRLIQMLPL